MKYFPRLGSSSCWWVKFSCLFLPTRVSIPMSCCSSQPLVHVWCFCLNLFCCVSLKLQETAKGSFTNGSVESSLEVCVIDNLGASQGPSVGRGGALEAFRSSRCQQPWDESLGTRHNALSTAGSSPLVRFSTAAPREINVF